MKRYYPMFYNQTYNIEKLQLKVEHVIMRNIIHYYPHSDISSLGNLNAIFLALSRAWMTLYSTVDYQGGPKNRSIYQSGSTSFATPIKSQLYQYFGDTLLYYVNLCYR